MDGVWMCMDIEGNGIMGLTIQQVEELKGAFCVLGIGRVR